MFKITNESIHEVMLKAIQEIAINPIHSKWLQEYNLNLAFSSQVSYIIARDYSTVLNDIEFNYLMFRVCKDYISYMDGVYHETR